MNAIIIISAMSKDRVIGSKDGLPWHIKAEYEHYLSLVKGNVVIMGRKSYEIFGKDLDSAANYVISRSYPAGEGYEVVSSLEEGIEKGRQFGKEIFVAGGGTIYKLGIEIADKMYLSVIKGDYKGDTYFPEIPLEQWELVSTTDHEEFEFQVWERRTKSAL